MDKIVLVSQQGSGTNVFRAIINQEPDIMFLSELFITANKAHIFDDAYIHYIRMSIPAYLDMIFEKYADKKIIGFDLKYNQIKNEKILDYIKDNSFKTIHLTRDPLRTFWKNHRDSVEWTKRQVDVYVDRIEKYMEQYIDWFDEHTDQLVITYEEMTLGQKLSNHFPKTFDKKIRKFLYGTK